MSRLSDNVPWVVGERGKPLDLMEFWKLKCFDIKDESLSRLLSAYGGSERCRRRVSRYPPNMSE